MASFNTIIKGRNNTSWDRRSIYLDSTLPSYCAGTDCSNCQSAWRCFQTAREKFV